MARNAHWYNRNETRNWPLDDESTAVDDAGRLLPTDIICDLKMVFPSALGQFAFVSNVTVTPSIVTVVISGADKAINPSTCTNPGAAATQVGIIPLATVTVRKPLVVYQNYDLQPFQDGVIGWVVFGAGANQRSDVKAAFSAPQQSAIAVSAARRAQPPAIRSIGKYGDVRRLTGVVTLRSGEDARWRIVPPAEYVNDDGVVNLDQYASVFYAAFASGDLPHIAQLELYRDGDASVFSDMAGPCGKRPESLTCEDPEPIRRINGVEPNCEGILTLDFTGCAEIAKIVEGASCGGIIDCGFELIDACEADVLPDLDGNLPNNPASECP